MFRPPVSRACWFVVFHLETLMVCRPPVSYFVLAAFFTISTLRLTGLTARGLRYRYGEKIPLQVLAAGSCSCWLAPTAALPGLNWTALNSASNVLRLPFAFYFRLLVKKTTLVGKCQTPIIARNFFHANAKNARRAKQRRVAQMLNPIPLAASSSPISSLCPAQVPVQRA